MTSLLKVWIKTKEQVIPKIFNKLKSKQFPFHIPLKNNILVDDICFMNHPYYLIYFMLRGWKYFESCNVTPYPNSIGSLSVYVIRCNVLSFYMSHKELTYTPRELNIPSPSFFHCRLNLVLNRSTPYPRPLSLISTPTVSSHPSLV